MQERSLQAAVRKVLTEAAEPLHYREISAIIAAEDLWRNMGATPDRSVAAALSIMRKNGEPIAVPRRGYYLMVTSSIETSSPASLFAEDEEEPVLAEDAEVSVAAYGLYWERDKVEWDVSGQKVELFGQQNQAATRVNFADQQGVYLLYQMQMVTYVGRTVAESNGLFYRLKSHVRNPRRSGRWDRFSWFGVRSVSPEGELLSAPPSLSTDLLITILEAVLIETFLPPFNDKSGDLMGELYEQVIDPEIAKQRAQSLLREAVT